MDETFIQITLCHRLYCKKVHGSHMPKIQSLSAWTLRESDPKPNAKLKDNNDSSEQRNGSNNTNNIDW